MGIMKDAWDIIKDRAEWKEMQALVKKIPELEQRIAALEARSSNINSEDVCDHCGSSNLRRTGSRPNPTFKSLGVKDAVFLCDDCGKESAFIIEPSK
ncbi:MULTISPECIES: hypothetical protein [Nitrosomonas]|uniref:Uncharacterized protein n=1 Tax=Nitrosomonas communis TaxID=44574 RepID=A0A0F7KF91_9PROT|nr:MULTISPECIES: hypothetical protein [Nitrosomonas]AKH38161.1 hypothetical protein AAW31_10715 [Nitrosomonas communis]TYP69472.1 hypothetical protein BCL69_11494 [Nitrosomonas communis]UVS60113.1 hypothetical protein NX761_11315 [Nitrosomonas sp. PLL12]